MQISDQIEILGTGMEQRQNAPAELSIIIVNWNSFAYLRTCLESIYRQEADVRLEVIVVDNGSVGEDTAHIAQNFPDALVLRSRKNLGFAGANNLGVSYASGSYLLFLNPDTEIIGGAIGTMLDRMKALPDAAIMGCRLMNSDGSVQTSCIQRFPTIANQLLDIEPIRLMWPHWKIWGIGSLFSDPENSTKVEVVSGACLMTRRDVFEAAGMFNRDYFMYAEDVDLCFQVKRLGWNVYSTNDASVIHHGGGTSMSRKGSVWVAVMQRQAILQFCQRTRGAMYAEAYRATTGLAAMLRLIVIGLMLPFRLSAEGVAALRATAAKWSAVLKWALGRTNHLFAAPESN